VRNVVVALLLAIGVSIAGPALLQAAPIVLFNTGVDGLGLLLADGAVDLHYQLIVSADSAYPGPNAMVANSAAYPIVAGPWVANGPNSKWIGPRTDVGSGNTAGAYIYRTTFDLTGLLASTAVINGLWTTDNDGVDILLNGASLGFTTGFTAFTALNNAFTINSGFVPGPNTLDFVVNNGGGPTGLRVELSGTADASESAVPEPATTGLIGLGIVGGAWLLRRRQAAGVSK